MSPYDLRLSPEDRPGGPTHRSKPKSSKKSGKAPASTRRAKPRKAKKTKRAAARGGIGRTIGRMAYWTAVLGVWGLIAVMGVVGYFAMTLPPPEELAVPDRPANVMVVAADGTVLGNRGETGGEAVRLFELPPYLPQAVMAIEDRRFYSHFGVDPIGLARAAVTNFTAGGVVQGGSTLTQQLAKNLFLKPERTIRRKVQEVLLALWLEHKFSKDQILEMYLNRVYLGAGATGVEAAARTYYGKSAREVTVSEAATIAGLLKAPSRYAPTSNPDLAEQRAQTVLSAMVEAGYLTDDEAKLALISPAEVKPRTPGESAGYVADWIWEQVPSFIGELRGDVVVDTTIDMRMQEAAEAALVKVIDEHGKEKGVSEGALVAMDTSGAVRAIIGGRNYTKSQFNRAVKAKRQSGSSFKTFVYAAAIEAGLSPDTLRTDGPISFGNWSPGNYNGKYRGPITLTEALKDSINTVAVRLTSEVGVDKVIDVAHRMGIRSDIPENMSIALGTSDVTPLELVGAYVPLASGGYGAVPYVIRRIRTADGKVLYERNGDGPGQVLSSETVGAMNYMLKQTVENGTGRRAGFDAWPAAGKTGTSQEYKNAWFIGYTAYLVTGVWLGNDDGKPTKRVTGGNLPATVWHDFMADAHEGLAMADLPGEYIPGTGTQYAVDETLPWLQGNPGPQGPTYDPSRPVQAQAPQQGGGGGLFGQNGFFKKLFGG
ncbi:transglycosylase domain-containing protein [Microbaculum marinisediminis]|uniref:Penicillin-binding protein 1A n=1 Tax=Microbaculum marinisediminis TaxID=2931392 RepID=A0AAW5QVJ4_9HYPH|nr:penicillin-binding protein 1A [Microbaculum sp. A6E488]MCT8972081.1 penicillin-binding protein 1A [Microbaculum sp. A6E488]